MTNPTVRRSDFDLGTSVGGKRLERESPFNVSSSEAASPLSTTNQISKISAHRHKKAETVFELNKKEPAGVGLLSSASYKPLTKKRRDNKSVDRSETATPIDRQETQPKLLESNSKQTEKNSHLPSTAFIASNPPYDFPKTTPDGKKLIDKKVRFSAATTSETNNDTESEKSGQTLRAELEGKQVVVPSSLSPAIWDKSSEPKIWLKEGKPTLFQPSKEPGYYTCPLWSRQYPEIFSDDPKVNPYAANCAASIITGDDSQSSSTSNAANNNTFTAGRKKAEEVEFRDAECNKIHSPPLASHQSITVPPPTPPGFNYPPVYRNRVVLEVGGRRFVSSIDVLERSPYFKHLFSVPFLEWYRDGILHIDNDPDLFGHILRYLRTGSYPFFWDACNGFDYAMYAMVLQQARYYLLPKLEAWIINKKYLNVVQTEVLHQKTSVGLVKEWDSKLTLNDNDSYEISGVVTSSRNTNVHHGAVMGSDFGKIYNSEERRVALEEEAMSVDCIQVFTTMKKTEVNIEMLRCEYESQAP
ncbi:uncharacterized protein CTRU02_205313 [Colletotrichum truncatum]|uniref:Uncharacterized protein n=1 Tax=Colletotrichum truncatum TaxID=5467 RepID=A0ACC3Z3N3_COLTU|nr:uncharacterized protein CTRU02_04370 [Colletotrichum truncatum]KAF6795560.1 hypothetical protein CTRU02_04370 [Colletotrichum truncatum]